VKIGYKEKEWLRKNHLQDVASNSTIISITHTKKGIPHGLSSPNLLSPVNSTPKLFAGLFDSKPTGRK
jgi:hypothetical protein